MYCNFFESDGEPRVMKRCSPAPSLSLSLLFRAVVKGVRRAPHCALYPPSGAVAQRLLFSCNQNQPLVVGSFNASYNAINSNIGTIYILCTGGRSAVMALFGIDEIDLKRGEGDWTNMQPVVRKSFAAIFDVIEKQQQQIAELKDTVSKLKREVDKKPNQSDISRQITDARTLTPDVMRKSDLMAVHALLVDVKADVERKASVRYVDDSCRRKIDKSDVSMRPLLQNAEHISKLSVDLAMLKQHVDKYDQIPAQLSEIKAKAASKDDVKNVLSRIDSLSATVAERPDSDAVLALLSNKADVKEIDGRVDLILNHRHDGTKDEIEALERMMLDHEHRLTTVEYAERPTSREKKRTSEPARQLSQYTKIIEKSIAGAPGLKQNGIVESRKQAQIECMQHKLDDCCDRVYSHDQLYADFKNRIQRLEGNVAKVSHDSTNNLTMHAEEIRSIRTDVTNFQRSAVSTQDEVEHKLSSLHHLIESDLVAPLRQKLEAVEFNNSASHAALATLNKEVNQQAQQNDALGSKLQKIENAVLHFNQGVMADVKKEMHRLKSDRTAAQSTADAATSRMQERQHEMDLKLRDIERTMQSQLDVSGSKFKSVGDMAVAVRTLKQTVKTIIDTTLQQNKKLQSLEITKSKSDEGLRTDLAVDFNSRLIKCETAVHKLGELEVQAAVNGKSITMIESDLTETRKLANNFHVQFAEVLPVLPIYVYHTIV